jgi:hypothetical protein
VKYKTKPIGAGIGGQGSEASDLTPAPWTFAPNKANFGGSRIAAKPFAGLELCPMHPTHRSAKTKPIWTGIGGQGSAASHLVQAPWAFVRNEANCPKRGTEAVSRLRIADWGQTWGATPALACCLRPRTFPGADCAKPTQFRGSAGWNRSRLCETNPIR